MSIVNNFLILIEKFQSIKLNLLSLKKLITFFQGVLIKVDGM